MNVDNLDYGDMSEAEIVEFKKWLLLMEQNNKKTNESLFSSKPHTPGVYMIWNAATNKKYIGQSQDISNRLSSHISRLQYGKHQNQELQEEFNKYGPDEFKLEILEKEIGHKQHRLDLEYKWMEKYKKDLYNKNGRSEMNKQRELRMVEQMSLKSDIKDLCERYGIYSNDFSKKLFTMIMQQKEL